MLPQGHSVLREHLLRRDRVLLLQREAVPKGEALLRLQLRLLLKRAVRPEVGGVLSGRHGRNQEGGLLSAGEEDMLMGERLFDDLARPLASRCRGCWCGYHLLEYSGAL